MVLVDTSVWIVYFRAADPSIVRTLDVLIDEDAVATLPPIRLELISGCRRSERAGLIRCIDALHQLSVSDGTWTAAEDLALGTRRHGVTLGAVDLLIAAACDAHQVPLWTLDRDFDPLFGKGLVKPYRP